MPKILNPDGSVQRLCKLVPSPSDLLLRRFTRGKTKAASNRHFELHDSGYDKIMFVPYSLVVRLTSTQRCFISRHIVSMRLSSGL